MRRTNRVIYFDGQPALYQECLGVLFSAGVDAQQAVTMLDTCQLVPEGEAQFFLKKLWGAITGGAKKVAESSAGKAVSGAVAKGADAVKKADDALGKAGSDEECEWITIHGAKGTARLCIDHEGKIAKGPSDMKGKDAKATLDKGHHGGIDKATASAKQKREKLHHLEKSAGNKVTEWTDRMADTLEFVSDPGAGAAGAAVGKVLGEKVGPIKKQANKIKAHLREKYGPAGAAAIQVAGIALHQVTSAAADVALPGLGRVISAVPLAKEAHALVVAAGVDQVAGLHQEAKALGGAIKDAIKHVVSGGQADQQKAAPADRAETRKKNKKKLKRQKKREAAAAAASATAGFGDQGVAKEPQEKDEKKSSKPGDDMGGLSLGEVKKLGAKWWAEHEKACLAELYSHPDWKKIIEMVPAGKKSNKKKKKKATTKS